MPRRSIFGEVKDTNKRGQWQIYSNIAERKYLRQAKDTKSRKQCKLICFLPRRNILGAAKVRFPFVSPRPAEDVPDAAGGAMPPSAWAAAGFRSSAAAEERIFRNCILAGLRPAGSHCKNNLILTSGSIPHLRLGVSCKERIYHLLSPKGGAKSVRRAPTSGSDGAMRNLRCTARNDDYLLISYFSRSPACRIALRKERKDSYAPLHSVRNDKSCHPQEEVQTNSDTGIAPCIAPQTAEKKAVSDRFSAHLPENRKIIRNFAGQSINCRARI